MLHLGVSPFAHAWPPRIAAALLWAAAVGLALLWVLHWPGSAASGAQVASFAPPSAHNGAAVALALGHSAPSTVAAPDEHQRFQLLGVIAAPFGQGRVLMAVDGQAPKVYPIGQALEGGWVVLSASPTTVTLQRQGQRLELHLPLPKSL